MSRWEQLRNEYATETNYCGPGTDTTKSPVNAFDYACQRHDRVSYQGAPYSYDRQFHEEIKNINPATLTFRQRKALKAAKWYYDKKKSDEKKMPGFSRKRRISHKYLSRKRVRKYGYPLTRAAYPYGRNASVKRRRKRGGKIGGGGVRASGGSYKQMSSSRRFPNARLSRRVYNRFKKQGKVSRWQKHFEVTGTQISSATNQCSHTDLRALLRHSDLDTLMGKFQQIESIDGVGDGINAIDMAQFNTMGIVYKYSGKYWFANNTTYPAKLIVYVCMPKIDTDVVPTADIITGANEMAQSAAGWATEPFFYPGMSHTFKRKWRVVKSQSIRINPGDSTMFSVNLPLMCRMNESADDTSSLAYLRNRSAVILTRLEGVVVHDQSTTTNVGIGETNLDVIIKESISYAFLGGNQIKNNTYSDQRDAISTAVKYSANNTTEEVFAN